VEVKGGQRDFVEGAGGSAQELGGSLGPQQRNPSIRGVPNIGSIASTMHRTETTGMSAAGTPGW